jgi:hypothetical protein
MTANEGRLSEVPRSSPLPSFSIPRCRIPNPESRIPNPEEPKTKDQMRQIFVPLHRWLDLFIAVFLFASGMTGAVIFWDHELDEWLNPSLYQGN